MVLLQQRVVILSSYIFVLLAHSVLAPLSSYIVILSFSTVVFAIFVILEFPFISSFLNRILSHRKLNKYCWKLTLFRRTPVKDLFY